MDDYYINTETGAYYRCVLAGNAATAKWAYVGKLNSVDDKLAVINNQISDVNNELISTKNKIEDETSVNIAEVKHSGTFTTNWTLMGGLDGYERGSIIYANDRFISVGGCNAYYSTDGVNWVKSTIESGGNTQNGIAYGNGRFVSVGDNGSSYYSTDGLTWKPMSGISSGLLHEVTYGNGRFVCAYLDNAYYSTDGLTWTAMSGIDNYDHHAITYGNGRFVSVGVGASGSYYTTDGLTWNAMSGLQGNVIYNRITYGNGRFVCVGNDGKSYYSTDGSTWTAMSGLESITYNAVTYGNGIFVCVGKGGKSYYSSDGENWVAMSGNLEPCKYNGVAYGNGRFVCVGGGSIGVNVWNGMSYYCLYKHTNSTLTTRQSTVSYAVEELYTKSVIVKKALTAGSTEITIENDNITEDSMLSFYTSIYSVNPTEVSVAKGSVTLKFDAQETDIQVGVRVDG